MPVEILKALIGVAELVNAKMLPPGPKLLMAVFVPPGKS